MASQPPAGSGPMPASSTGPDRGSGAPPEPSPTSRAKRRRDTEAQPARPSLVGSQPDASTTTPLTAKGPSTVNGTAAGAVLTALSEEAKLYEARKDVFMAIAQSVDNVVSCFEGPRKQIAKEATTYVVQALKRIMGNGTAAPTPSRNWAKVVASAESAAPAPAQAPAPAPARTQNPIHPQAQTQTLAQPKEDLRVFARIPEEGLTAARKHAPFALRRKVCQALGLQLADIPHIYHIATGYSLRPLNKQVQQALLTDKQKLADSLGAYKVETPTKWFTYVVPRCPAKLWTIDGDALDPATLVEEEVFAQTGCKPIRARQSQLGVNPITNEVSWIISFSAEVLPFRLFNQSSRSQLIQKKKTIARHDPGCQGYHSNRYCNRQPLCGNCSRPSGSHETWPCIARPKCANCAGPFQANHKGCPARPLVVNGSPTLPGRKELSRIRKAGQKAYEALYQNSQASTQATDNHQRSSGDPTRHQPGSKRPRAPTPAQDSITVADASDTASSSSMDEDENEAEADVYINNNPDLPPLPTQHTPPRLSSRAQRVAQKPDYNVTNAYTHLDLDSEQ
ncbi:hypothetical protein CFRS1_v009454 [Colletotrichum fructicola]|nr:hypothetical protein CFRS1_v015820 [Colletotrichum fructicola]KAF4418480.1 hypothetical protein CFRS1_v015868 [Colletotrichum fructicola]KAF4418499.1 hypothetical protein CFRS1_v015722 [Colletotrichum fructicola]KAF4418871.1 hypothetical protein CFRS1_v015285 [Colletotrichum fructicola]KAF4420073.1 hypothetical protein CFRS1_v014921 [Colletotrichum fructicola]